MSTSEDQSATQTENENDIELTPFFSGIALDVTPQIDRSVSLAEAMIASQKSSVAFEATVQVRNKLVESYKEIMNMPV